MSQTEHFQIALSERQRKSHAFVRSEGKDGLAVLSPQEIGDASHRVRL